MFLEPLVTFSFFRKCELTDVAFLRETQCFHIAYLRVHSLAEASYLARSVLYTWAISGTRGSSGLGSVRREQMDSRTFLYHIF